MTTMARPQDDLGTQFEQRWARASQQHRQTLMGDLQDILTLLAEDDIPLLASNPEPASTTATATKNTTAPQQSSLLFSAVAPSAAPPTTETPRKENPFLPKSILDRLNQQHALPPITPPSLSISHEQSDLERELRLKVGPVIESLLNSRIEQLKNELRVQLRTEMDRLIAEHVRKN